MVVSLEDGIEKYKQGGDAGLSVHWKWWLCCNPIKQTLQAQQIKIFIRGNKLQHPIEDEKTRDLWEMLTVA